MDYTWVEAAEVEPEQQVGEAEEGNDQQADLRQVVEPVSAAVVANVNLLDPHTHNSHTKRSVLG